jgi:PIN domain nuclease of toxin-antitoxin system
VGRWCASLGGRDEGHPPSHHRDPFDRILIAQAQVEGLVVISRDQSFTLYDLKLIRA